MTTLVRFAPSPTGNLHPGNARTALLNWVESRHDGEFILRIDDTDAVRSTQHYADAIVEDLAWLGITPDKIIAQSARFDAYQTAFEQLRSAGRIYPCYETPEELNLQRSALLRSGKPPVYDRRALKLSELQRKEMEQQGHRPYWRFMLSARRVEWHDLCRGTQTADLCSMSDPVIRRGDGAWLYTLPSVVDDRDMGITLVLRGEDHVSNTGVQIDMFDALGVSSPNFAHHPLLSGSDGGRLSKRNQAVSLQNLRADGFEPQAVAEVLLGIGSYGGGTKPDRYPAPEDIQSSVENSITSKPRQSDALSRVGKSSARFDLDSLERANTRQLQSLSFQDVKHRLLDLGIRCDEPAWLAIRGNISRLAHANKWCSILHDPPQLSETQQESFQSNPLWGEVISSAISQLPPQPWDSSSWKKWTDAVSQLSTARGKSLFIPLRIALTGDTSGPELAKLFPLMRVDTVNAALNRALSYSQPKPTV